MTIEKIIDKASLDDAIEKVAQRAAEAAINKAAQSVAEARRAVEAAIKQAAKLAAEATVKAMLEFSPAASEWMNTPQAAFYTKFSEEYLEIPRHRDDGSGPPFHKHPRAVRYRRVDLDAWMASFPQGGADPRPLEQRAARRAKAGT